MFANTKTFTTKAKCNLRWCGLLLSLFASCSQVKNEDASARWEVYGGNNGKTHYSSLHQIDTANVKNLRVAWVYHTLDAGSSSQIQVNPVIIGHTLYGVSPQLVLFAVDAATGVKKWVFNPGAAEGRATEGEKIAINVCRGVTYCKDEKNGDCIFYTAGSSLYCVAAATGKRVASFGAGGSVDLHEGLGRDVKDLYVTSTTPGTLYKDMIIVGTRVAEEAGAAPGHIRAYDVHTGAIRWTFHTIPFPGEAGYNTWEDTAAYRHSGGVNAWAGFCLDEENGMVFAPIGSATYDFYGGRRKGNNLYANCVLALDAQTGKRIWHFQTVHHDVWDRDPPATPVLVTVTKAGKKIDAVVQVTKSGFIFLLNKQTGAPVYPVVETPMPSASELTGEKLSATQPVPTFFEPFCRQTFTEADLNRLVPDSSYQDIKKRFAGYKKGNYYTPPSKEGTLLFPGTLGGAEWGGPAFDAATGILYVNANQTGNIITMAEVKQAEGNGLGKTNLQAGMALYNSTCIGCHGANRQGGGTYPSLIGVNKTYNEASFISLLNAGRRMMPAFKYLSDGEKEAIATYILDLKSLHNKLYTNDAKPKDDYATVPYMATGYNRFLTREGYPANMPPWGTLTAISLNTGKVVWQNTLGDYPEFTAKGIHTGSDNFGGPVVTSGGLLFIAATRDAKFRAYNKRTGALLWEADLPAAGFATPSVYEVAGKQYIVIACGGGGKAKAASGDAYVAFALPETNNR